MKILITPTVALVLVVGAAPVMADRWEQLHPEARPSASYGTAIWTGREILWWGSRYDPIANRWTVTNASGAPSLRSDFTTVWTGSELIVWGGSRYVSGSGWLNYNDGARYNPVTDTWSPVSMAGAPSPRGVHTAVWTGSEMIIWGGSRSTDFNRLNNGGRYNPSTDTWAPLSTSGAPAGRIRHSAVWAGNEMIVWGGIDGSTDPVNTGGRYNPVTNTWAPMTVSGAPIARQYFPLFWTGSEVIVWGGVGTLNGQGNSPLPGGGRYRPATNSWTTVTSAGAPVPRGYHTAVWTGNEMIVWGGCDQSYQDLATGGRYDPAANKWTATTLTGAPAAVSAASSVWTGSEMLVWGGFRCQGGSDPSPYMVSYTPQEKPLRVTSLFLENLGLTLDFQTMPRRTYTLWQSDSMAEGTWADTGLQTLTGTGGTMSFTVPAETSGRRFFRVQAGP